MRPEQETVFERNRLSFGPHAQAYDRVRPTYPAQALTWAVGEPPATLADLGAGTGLLTRVALAAGFEVLPVEPDAGMRERLEAATPGVTALAGSAERIPLPDGSADGALAGQSYHWFDRERAHPEIARVLRPGGVLAAFWNDRDLGHDWARHLDEILTGESSGIVQHPENPDFGPLFGRPERGEFPHRARHTPQSLEELVTTRSYYITGAPQRREQLLDAVRQLCATHPDLAGKDSFELPYVTVVYRAVRL